MFASDEEPVPAPAKVNPAPKQPKGGNKKEVPKTVEAPAFPNKSECNDAEAKFHAALSQVVSILIQPFFFFRYILPLFIPIIEIIIGGLT